MNGVYLLQNEIKHYEWGSPKFIPELLQIKNDDNKPYSELWMGAHHSSPSLALAGTSSSALDVLIESDKKFFLGDKLLAQFDGLPYLLKLLAAEKPLSIQAHPNLEQAKRGFEKENRQNIPLDGHLRNYKDANHKPEILCAISPFRALCGFRPVKEIGGLLKKLNCPELLFLHTLFSEVFFSGGGGGMKKIRINYF
jgi:mannose-6-phosphate isomerase